MNDQHLYNQAESYMKKLCKDISDRSVGSKGNIEATEFFESKLSSLGWATNMQKFDALDWWDGGAKLKSEDTEFEVFVSPFSKEFSGRAMLATASDMKELENKNFEEKIILLHGNIAGEQLMPKNFVFYNPERHQKIVSLLENSKARAIICATGRNNELAGGVYPFPLIEDGDFEIPSVYLTEEEGKRLLTYVDKQVFLEINSKRIPSYGNNVIGKQGKNESERIVITAHIDAKKGTPGAIDNASGVAILLVLAEFLSDYEGDKQIEITAFNGEDYYSSPGQMKFIMEEQDDFDNIILNINIDGAAYKEGKTAIAFYDLPDMIKKKGIQVINKYPDIVEGSQFPQGDHSIFLQKGRPAVTVSSEWLIENLDDQDITHTEKDNLQIIDYQKIINTAVAVKELINKI